MSESRLSSTIVYDTQHATLADTPSTSMIRPGWEWSRILVVPLEDPQSTEQEEQP